MTTPVALYLQDAHTIRHGVELPRQLEGVLLTDEVMAALSRLNPVIPDHPARAEEGLSRLRAVLLSVTNDGLISSNQEMVDWLRGFKTHKFVGTDKYEPVRLIDFDEPRSNSLIVSTEVTYRPGHEERRFDVVLWVSGFPERRRPRSRRRCRG